MRDDSANTSSAASRRGTSWRTPGSDGERRHAARVDLGADRRRPRAVAHHQQPRRRARAAAPPRAPAAGSPSRARAARPSRPPRRPRGCPARRARRRARPRRRRSVARSMPFSITFSLPSAQSPSSRASVASSGEHGDVGVDESARAPARSHCSRRRAAAGAVARVHHLGARELARRRAVDERLAVVRVHDAHAPAAEQRRQPQRQRDVEVPAASRRAARRRRARGKRRPAGRPAAAPG